MKPFHFILTLAMVAVPAIGLATPVNPPNFAAGDLLMGFRATGGDGVANTYVVNIGSAATYRDATATVTATVGNIAADLAAIYGPNWHSRDDLFWGIAGSPANLAVVNGDPAKTIYASRAEASPNTPGDPWVDLNSTIRGDISTRMQTMTSTASGFRNYERTQNSNWAVSQPSSDASSWAAFMAGGSATSGLLDFDAFADIEGLPAQTLSLFRAQSSTSVYRGSFAISDTGVLTFTPAPATGTTYATWAATNVGGAAHTEDTDGDGVPNGIEFFMGENGSTFTASPHIAANGTITWPRAAGRTVTSVVVQTSSDLVNWVPAASGAAYNASSVVYTVPAGEGKHFIRLLVTP